MLIIHTVTSESRYTLPNHGDNADTGNTQKVKAKEGLIVVIHQSCRSLSKLGRVSPGTFALPVWGNTCISGDMVFSGRMFPCIRDQP